MRPIHILLAGCVLLLAALPMTLSLTDDSLWYDEAWTVFALSATPPDTYEPPRGLRAQVTTPLKAALDDLRTTVERVRNDVHPPLYFLLMDAWTFIAGDSVLALRWPSLVFTLLTVALLVQLGRVLFNPLAGLWAGALFAVLAVVGYYAAETRMYALLMTLATASTLAYVRLLRRVTVSRVVLYGVLVGLALLTHYAAIGVVLAHGWVVLFMRPTRRKLFGLFGAGMVTLIVFGGWLPIFWQQVNSNPNGALAIPLMTDWGTVSALWLVMSGGAGLWLLLMGVMALVGVWHEGNTWRGVLLGVVWLLVTPTLLLTLNALWRPAYQVRYVLGALPALALIGGYGLATLGRYRWGVWMAAALWGVAAWTNVTQAESYWPSKPDYAGVTCAAADNRQPLDLLIYDIAQRDPMRYHAPRCGLLDGLTIDLSWRDHTPQEIDTLLSHIEPQARVWVILPTNVNKTWQIVAKLESQGRTIGYRANVENMIVYRFDPVDMTSSLLLPLTFRFGDVADYTGTLAEPRTASAGETLTFIPPIAPHADDVGVALTIVRGYGEVMAQADGVGNAPLSLTVPDEIGAYTVYLTLYDRDTGERYPIWQDNVWWGWHLAAYTLDVR